MRRKSNTKKSFYTARLSIPALFFYGLFIVVPFFMSMVLSFTDWNIDRLFRAAFGTSRAESAKRDRINP